MSEQLSERLGTRWLRGRDLNPRPLGYEPNELPDCSTPHIQVTSPLHRCQAPLPGLKATASPDPALSSYMRILGRIGQDPAEAMRSIMARCYEGSHKRCLSAFIRALPNQSTEEVRWQYTALTGVFVTMAQHSN